MAGVFAQSLPLRVSLNDLDGDEVTFRKYPAKFDFAVDTATELIDDFVLIDDLAAGDWVVVDVGDVSSEGLLVM